MGIKRIVDTSFWEDEKVELFTPEEKYFWLYLLTNPHTRQLGIYHITKKQMAFHLGYDIETVTKLLNRFEKEYGLIRYAESEIAIKNFLKHSIVKGGKPVEDCLLSDMAMIKHKSLIKWVFGNINLNEASVTVQKVIRQWQEESNKEEYINDNDNDNDSIVDVSPTIRGRFVPPTIEEVAEYCKERNNNVDPKKFYDYYNVAGWKDAKGNPVKNWKQKMIANWEKEKEKKVEEKVSRYVVEW